MSHDRTNKQRLQFNFINLEDTTVITRNSGIGCRPLDFSYDFKYSNEHETQQLCRVNRPISLISA